MGIRVPIPIQEHKLPRAAVVIWATKINIHRETTVAFDLLWLTQRRISYRNRRYSCASCSSFTHATQRRRPLHCSRQNGRSCSGESEKLHSSSEHLNVQTLIPNDSNEIFDNVQVYYWQRRPFNVVYSSLEGSDVQVDLWITWDV